MCVLPLRHLARGYTHIPNDESNRLRNLGGQWPGNLLGIQLPRGAVVSTVLRGCNGGLRQPILWRLCTEQHPGHRRSNHAGIVLRQKVEVHQSAAWVRSPSDTQQGLPQPLAQSLEARPRHDLLVEPQVAALCSSLP